MSVRLHRNAGGKYKPREKPRNGPVERSWVDPRVLQTARRLAAGRKLTIVSPTKVEFWK